MKNWDKMRRQKYWTTAVVYYCNISMGVSVSFMAPLLIDFCRAFETDMQTISAVMTGTRALALISSLSFGFIFNLVNRHLATTCLVFLMGLKGILLPYSGTLISFSIFSAILSISAGGYGTAQIVWIIDIWKDASGPYIQAQHFFYAFGTMLPPLIFAPFLNSGKSNVASLKSGIIDEGPHSLEHLYIPCGICGGIGILGGIFLLLNYCAFREKSLGKGETSPLLVNDEMDSHTKDEFDLAKSRKGNLVKKVLLILFCSALIGGVESMEGIISSFLPTYGYYSDTRLSEAEGAHVLSAYSIAYTVARLVGILVILKVSARWILCGNLIIVCIANLVLLYLGGNSLTYMYVGSILLGIGFSTSVPNVFAYAQLHLDITNVVGSILYVAGGCVAAAFPVIVGSYIEKTPEILIYVNLACAIASFGSLLTIFFIMRKTVGKL